MANEQRDPATRSGAGVMLITGCSSGIGRALAVEATAAGYTVIATARRVETLDALEAAMRLQLDVTSEASIRAGIDAACDRFGHIDVLVNNAGYATCAAVEELSDDVMEPMFDVNVFGVIRMMRAVSPIMREQGSGRIVNISSIGGAISLPVNGGYSATKFAVEALSDAARLELAPFGVHVIVVRPGAINTRFDDTMRACSADVLEDARSPYRTLYRASDAMSVKMRDGQAGPEAVAHVVLKALSAKRPRPRYRANVELAVRILAAAGDRMRDAALSRVFADA